MYRCRLKNVLAMRLVVMRARVAPLDFGPTMRWTLEAVWRQLNEQEHVRVGPAMARYHEVSDRFIDFEAGFPVAEDVDVTGEVHVIAIQGGPAATALHTGPYSDLAHAYEALRAWMREQGHEPAGAPYEVYWVDAGQAGSEDELRTEVVWPVAERGASEPGG